MNTFYKRLKEKFNDKNILILGFGREGKSTFKLLKEIGGYKFLAIMDENVSSVKKYFKDIGQNQDVLIMDEYLSGFEKFDYIFKTPGIPGFLIEGVDKSKIYSQAQLFMEFLGERCVAITGTKGKSTTSSMLSYILNNLGIENELVGNIGRPALEVLLKDDGKKLYVYEMSSYQTEFLMDGANIGVVLNLYQEHLNNYKDYMAYKMSKINLLNVGKGIKIFGSDNEELKHIISQSELQNLRSFGLLENNTLNKDGYYLEGEDIIKIYNGKKERVASSNFERKLLGKHNLLNSLAVLICIDEIFRNMNSERIDIKKVIELIGSFEGLSHRLEYIGIYEDIKFYNDSISTIPKAAMMAIEAIKDTETIIVGGYNRNIDYEGFIEYLNSTNLNVICMPDTGDIIYKGIEGNKYKAKSMKEAVTIAYSITKKGGSVLLSPAASSYNVYKNFEERGFDYTKIVKELAKY